MGIRCAKVPNFIIRNGKVTYVNRRNGFAFDFPLEWRPFLVPDHNFHVFTNQPNISELPFRFCFQGQLFEPAFWIVKFKGPGGRRYFKNAFLTFLGQRDGVTFGYREPEELPGPFIDNPVKFRRAIKQYEEIVDGLFTTIRPTFRFIKTR